MPISNNIDLYETVRILSEELAGAGEERWSSALKDALSISTVPGEILGETRLQLEDLKSSGVPIQLDLEESVDEALRYLKKILGPR